LKEDQPKELTGALAKFEDVESRIRDLWLAIMKADEGKIFPLDTYVQGVIKRTLSQAMGIRVLLENANLMCARSLLRMQIDTAMRLFAARLVPNPHDFAQAVLDGKQINRMETKDGHKMTDYFLSTELAKKYEWVRRVYEHTSGYVHMSQSQFMLTVEVANEDRSMRWLVAADDRHMPVGSFVEVAECFIAATEIVIEYLEGWQFTKENPEVAAEMRKQQAEE